MQPLITDMDARRLRGLLATPVARTTEAAARRLSAKIERARVVPATAVPATVATMNSRLSCWSPLTGAARELSVVYPWASDPIDGRYSVLSGVGVEILATIPGRRIVVDGVTWHVLYIAYQPEARHDYHL